VRPFGLGSEIGAAGELAWFGLVAALALVMTRGSTVLKAFGVLGIAGGVLAIVTSESRGVILVGVFALLCYGVLATASRYLARSLGTLLLGGLMVLLVVTALSSHATSSTLRVRGLNPSQVAGTILSQRGNSLVVTPSLAVTFPFGLGLGRVGPAAGFSGSASGQNAENEFNYLIDEIGTVGLIIFLTLWVRVVIDGLRLVRSTFDADLRAHVAVLVTGLLALAFAWFYQTPSVATPTAPLFWTLAGIIAWKRSQIPVKAPLPKFRMRSPARPRVPAE
jgi:hypothetical protein